MGIDLTGPAFVSTTASSSSSSAAPRTTAAQLTGAMMGEVGMRRMPGEGKEEEREFGSWMRIGGGEAEERRQSMRGERR